MKTEPCELCGEPMPEGEEMFKYHGYSGDCPKPMNPLSTTQQEQDKLFDEKFPRFDELEIATLPDFSIEDKAARQNRILAIQQHNRKLQIIKDYLKSRDLAIEKAVRAELVKIVQKRIEEEKNEDRCAEQESRVWLLQEVLALLTTSPSR